MTTSVTAVRRFTIDTAERSTQLGESQIWITAGVEASEGGPLSAYRARFAQGERAPLPAPYEEVWTVLHGELRITSGQTIVVAQAGEFLHVPESSPGWVEAIHDTELVCVSVPAH